jgi:thiol-disulfide isomerase/thioredoxin
MPSLELLAQRYDRQGLQIVAINYRESEATIRRFLESMPLTLPIVRDADGSVALAWTPRVFPSTVVVARDGRTVCTVIGEADWLGEDARLLLAPLLAAPRAGASP